ncbi:MAG: dihydrolipoyl dehydrogenase [Proteobacteria bacterium]|nr:dihydrolipoyl dehydrogenase [Pseudomonadota bacterium]
MEKLSTDTLVLGGGPGGYAAAIRLGQLGIETILIEKRKVGGTCLNIGCIPSKALIHASNTYVGMTGYATKSMGISTNDSQIDWAKTIAWKDRTVLKLTKGIEYLLKSNNVRLIHGKGNLLSPTSVKVTGEIDYEINCKNIILATGSHNLILPQFQIDHKQIIDSTDLLSLRKIPESLIILGGGVIGLELGSVYGRIGCKVSVIEMLDRILPMYDEDATKELMSALIKSKVEIITGAKATKVEKGQASVSLTYETDSNTTEIIAEKLAVTIGRQPRIDSFQQLDPDLAIENGRVKVDGSLQTSIPNIYAIGDIVSGPMLAHKATAEGIIAAEKISGMEVSRDDIEVIPNVVYTKPELASVGLTEQQATEKNLDTITGKFPFSALGRAAITGATNGFVKYIADKNTEIVLGATIVSDHASELISEATLAIEMSATLEDIALTIHPHPSFGETHMEASAAGLKRATHINNN